jgi:SAM-dependent methyltransferase
VLIDRLVHAIALEDLRQSGVDVEQLALTGPDHRAWVERHVPDWSTRFRDVRHKKLLEFSITGHLLAPRREHVVLDAAGGMYTYVGAVACAQRYLSDIRIPADVRRRVGPATQYLECDARAIPLPDASVDRISCHHSFEHFQQASDTGFLLEVQRLLRPGGRCAIVPLFVATRYVEATDRFTLRRKFDRRSLRLIDPTASIPGGDWCGNYARIYDRRALHDRLLAHVDRERFRVRVVHVTLDAAAVPDMSLPFHRHVTAINHPMRALVIERRA